MNLDDLEKSLKDKQIYNAYIFYGMDEGQIKETIEEMVDIIVDPNFKDLNYMRLDGMNFEMTQFINACETLPFMAEKRVVEAFRLEHLRSKPKEKTSKELKDLIAYVKNMPEYTVFIGYYILKDKREKNRELDRLKGNIAVIKVEDLKGDRLYKKVQKIFYNKNVEIGKNELRYFVDRVDKDLNIINMEIEKLISYTYGRTIKKEDINMLLPITKDEDVFDLVDAISTNRTQRALMLCNDLIFKGNKETAILAMIERQFDLLLKARAKVKNRQSPDEFSKEFGLHPYVAKNLMEQSKKFNEKQLKNCLEVCLRGESRMKSSGSNNKIEIEMVLVDCARTKK
ncbi:DNA polymerase III subunit delta [Clostridium frigidicarnis]|uniref:DNA polymerase III subunit delta n=1 Tax=Clostridium frigidicarnis TaxID=84698 RepID=A0A1I0VFY4_9CLOT|nr:DNA polymerase III subunit delta [Clostridium frigidicarnis]SFA75399.1 DNA polymerase III, delta subunit [Clostridium frigidicarnis]